MTKSLGEDRDRRGNPHQDDRTVRRARGPSQTTRPARRRSRPLPIFVLAGGIGLAGSVSWWFGTQPTQHDIPPQAPSAAAPAVTAAIVTAAPKPPPPPPVPALAELDEDAILERRPARLMAVRFASDPRIVILLFPNLREQGRAMNRIGALVEKAGLPHDRVLDAAALNQAIARSGATPDTYYYGHDYRAADLRRFFALADQDGTSLLPEELGLRAMLRDWGMMDAGAPGALVTVPAEISEPLVDSASRRAILRHELSHGLFFVDADYAAWSRAFWTDALTEAERRRLRRFLADEGYDPANEELMLNEAQAYLIHTPDRRYFDVATLGWSPARLQVLRAAFVAGMPPGWLRDRTKF